jgi:hypothetical protein
MDHLVLDDALAAPITTPACHTHRPFLDMDDAFMTPITTSSSSCGIAPQPAARGIAPPTAFTSRRCPPPHMESAAPPWIDKKSTKTKEKRMVLRSSITDSFPLPAHALQANRQIGPKQSTLSCRFSRGISSSR